MILASSQPFSWRPLGRTPTLGLLRYSLVGTSRSPTGTICGVGGAVSVAITWSSLSPALSSQQSVISL